VADVSNQPGNNGHNGIKRLGGITGKGFMPGKSGNPLGRAKGPTLMTLIRKRLKKPIQGGTDLKGVADAFIAAMASGSFQHLKEYIDREEGKVPDRIAGPDGGDLAVKVLRDVSMDEI
jgi:hypothetical protein